MKLSAVKDSITKNMQVSYAMPEDVLLAENVYEAMLYVASACEPRVLLRYMDGSSENTNLYRALPYDMYIMLPDMPDFVTSPDTVELMIDETLVYAVINYVCFLLSGEAKYFSICEKWINLSKSICGGGSYR